IKSEDSKVSVGNAAKQSHDVVGVGIDCIFNHAKVSTEADLGPQPDVIHLTSLDVSNESSQISSDADMVEQNKKDALDTLIRISQHKKPKKSNVARVVSEDYKCTPEDVQLIEYIKTLPGKQVVVNIDSAWLNRNDMECLFHGDIELSGEALSAYIHCIRDEEHLLHREGGKVFLENTFISSLLKRDGDPKDDITMFRFKLPAILWDSRLNTKKGHQNLDHNVDEDGESSSDVQIIDTPYCFNMAVRMIACNDALFLLEDKYHYMDLQFCVWRDRAHRTFYLGVGVAFPKPTLLPSPSGRQSKKAYLLIDFSDHLQISVYVLDPSLFIHRFTKLLLGRRNNDVSDTALCIVASMKRDWMQAGTGRKPSRLCGAALYIAALSHGCNYTKADIVSPDAHEISRTYSTNRYYVYSLLSTYDLLFYTLVSVVHVCEATLTKRLIEFENTDSGSLTVFLLRCEHAYIFMPLCYIEEFLATTDESNEEPVSKHSPKSGEIICKHKDKGFEHFAHGLCEKCYNKFTKLSGGLEGGSVPPAFQRAEKKRLEAAKRAEEAAAAKEAALEESLCDTQNSEVESAMTPRKGLSGDKSSKMGSEGLINDSMPPKDPEEGEHCCRAGASGES
ncbi:hypothetical protein ACJX0J_035836, partial [Zea mays]